MGQNGEETSTAIVVSNRIREAANLPAEIWNDERIKTICKTVAPAEASVPEIALFLAVAHRYDLDPLIGEIWMAKSKGKIITLTGRDSFLKTARRDPAYGGFKSGVVHEKDIFAVDTKPDGDVIISHRIEGIKRGAVVGAYCVVYVKGRPPVLVIREWADYKHLHGKDNWKDYGPDMIETRVITAAHRRAFSISGLYAPEEFVGGELDRGPDTESGRSVSATRERLNDLGSRLEGKRAPRDEHEIQDAEFTIDEEPEAKPEPEKQKATRKAKPKPEPEPEPEPDVERGSRSGKDRSELNKLYFFKVNELGWSDVDRKLWQQQRLGSPSCKDWTADQFEAAIALIDRGEVDVEYPEPAKSGRSDVDAADKPPF